MNRNFQFVGASNPNLYIPYHKSYTFFKYKNYSNNLITNDMPAPLQIKFAGVSRLSPLAIFHKKIGFRASSNPIFP